MLDWLVAAALSAITIGLFAFPTYFMDRPVNPYLPKPKG